MESKKELKSKLIELIKFNNQFKGTNYEKILIEGNNHIYLTHPFYKHSDYNKSIIFKKNEYTIRLMNIFNYLIIRK